MSKRVSAIIIISLLILFLIGGIVLHSQSISGGDDVGEMQGTRAVESTSPSQLFMKGYEEKGMYIKQASDILPMVEDGTALILDVRSYSLREDNYISRSRHIPMSELLERLDHIPTDRVVAVYCDKNISAAYAVAFLNMQGFDAYLLEDGLEAWQDAGGSIITCPT